MTRQQIALLQKELKRFEDRIDALDSATCHLRDASQHFNDGDGRYDMKIRAVKRSAMDLREALKGLNRR